MPPEITQEQLDALNAAQAERDALKKEKDDKAAKDKADAEAAEKKKKEAEGKNTDPDDENDLRNKVSKDKKTAEEKAAEARSIENNLKFNMGISQFVKENADLLPTEVPEILKVADKEKYDNSADQANAIRVAILQSYFSVEDNLSVLTPTQKTQLDDFLKLTKNGKEQKAESIYVNLFEPALATMKRVKKAEELGKSRSGLLGNDKVQDGYKDRLMKTSQEAYLGKKGEK